MRWVACAMLLAAPAWADTPPFMRKTEPFFLNVSPTAAITVVTQPVSAGQVRLVNRLPCDVRLHASDGTLQVTPTTGFVLLARSVEVISTNARQPYR